MGAVLVWVGVALAVVGIILIVIQMTRPPRRERARSLEAGAGPLNLALKTTYPGLVLVAFGVLLMVVGAVLA
jgi:hypothetical protein